MFGIKAYLVPFEETFQLFGERQSLMMFFLILDIFDDAGKSRQTDRKYAVAALPGETF